MNRLEKLRKEKRHSQEQRFAKVVGVDKHRISIGKMEKRQIKPEKAQTLADYFGVSVGYLLGMTILLR